MREILFRGKQLKDGKWTEGYYCPKPYSHFPCEPTIFPFETINKDWHGERVDPETVGQYTGLTDKNGRKIFEGDIVGRYFQNQKRYFTGIVEYGEFNCSCCNGVYGWHFDGEDIREHDKYEVLGNKFDNPRITRRYEK